MGKEIISLSPSEVWKHFYAFTQIPRPSKHEAKVVEYIKDFSEINGLKYTIEGVGNIIVYKPATSGRENATGVILQSHVDMVPQKNSSKVHNFETDPIETIIKKEWLHAVDTTLGADNGIGCAAMLAVLEAKDIKHGPIEALFTINEEAGMEGAFGLNPDLLKGKILLNLDSEDEGELFVGCAGGLNAEAVGLYSEIEMQEGAAFIIEISGLKGGHSGLDINLGRGNSNKLLGRFLWSAMSNLPLQIASITGGDLRNAIPREAQATILVPQRFENDLKVFVEQFAIVLKEELKHAEPELSIALKKSGFSGKVMMEEDAKRIVGVLNAAPNGVVRMSNEMEGIPETSLNLAITKVVGGTAKFFYLIRSFVDTTKYAVGEQVEALHQVNGFDVKYSGDYPGWRPNNDSYVLKVCIDTYQNLYTKTPGLLAIHAGLECGIIGGKNTELDMISFGPTICFPHSPDEKVHIASVDKFYKYLKATLEAIE